MLQFYWKNKQTQKIRINFQNLLKFMENPKQSLHLRSSCLHIFFKIGVFKNFANFRGKHLCWSLFLIKLQKETPIQVLSGEICKILWNSFFYRTPPMAAYCSCVLRWLVAVNAKLFWSYVKYFWIFLQVKNSESWLLYANKFS